MKMKTFKEYSDYDSNDLYFCYKEHNDKERGHFFMRLDDIYVVNGIKDMNHVIDIMSKSDIYNTWFVTKKNLEMGQDNLYLPKSYFINYINYMNTFPLKIGDKIIFESSYTIDGGFLSRNDSSYREPKNATILSIDGEYVTIQYAKGIDKIMWRYNLSNIKPID